MEYKIQSVNQLIEVVSEQKKGVTTLYRGMKSLDFELVPSIGRLKFKSDSLERNEKRIFKLFKESSVSYLKYQPKNEWEWLAVAQHYGLPTRFLDWSYNPLIAAYFAVEEEYDGDSIIYGIKTNSSVNIETDNPFEIKRVKRYTPPLISERINTQNGCFTVHPNPRKPFKPESMIKILIDIDFRRKLKQMLFKLGIRQRVIYPGLEGIAKDLIWLKTEKY